MIARDGRCVITEWNVLEYLVASHIIAFAYWKDKNKGDLPVSIQRIIGQFYDGIDDIQNGLLLESRLSSAFDQGHIAFRECDGGHYVVSIMPWFSEYEGKKLEIRDRSFKPPHPELLQFHLQLSVLKNMCGAGEDYSDDDDDDDGKMLDM